MPWMVAVLTWDADKKNQRGEKSLREILSDHFNMYNPRVRELVVENRRRVWREDFLFGRYSFVEIAKRWSDAYRFRGVQEILTSAATRNPVAVPDSEVDRFKRAEDSDGFVVLSERPRMRRGDACRVLSGSFEGQIGTYRGMGRRDCEVALMSYMGRFVRVEVAAGELVPA